MALSLSQKSNMFSPSTRGLTLGAGGLIIILLVFLSSRSPSYNPLDIATGRSRGYDHDRLLQDASNSTLGFQKIFVISLPSRTDHRDAMSLASAFTGLDIEYVDGVTEVNKGALPPHDEKFKLSDKSYGSWRAHMNALRLIVEQNLTTALVLEDDVDWDLRIKSQMQDFGRASQLLIQPGQAGQEERDISEIPRTRSQTSPYGDIDRWDLLWLGHCGSHLPQPTDDDSNPTVPLDRVVFKDDQTVPETQHLRFEFGGDALKNEYGNHTRVYSHGRRNVCNFAYGLSQQGARRFLHELAVVRLTSSTDLMFQHMCDGFKRRKRHTCLSVQPPLFESHRKVAIDAGLNNAGENGDESYDNEGFTPNIRWATMVNFPKLLAGETDYIDWSKDGEPRREHRAKQKAATSTGH
ncbi:uncharacterized protein MYCGRDRAFT_74064 [Zymoseptoria tritici IPO323]|uniref:Glycosyl transferase family 25 domain-containing protein n=3 Tax=Zymoseptoria tritici TaxID=1047171 RepID=F9XFX4_ZYMTI|nr:uncharacterized protein MYCGRDRAFT_74064 [Zymoseptoria tritici IPO323]EGP86104.1 hypothetical protein MYCGRDRAFT_74064 [Zymoseptoria tritici IPO323]